MESFWNGNIPNVVNSPRVRLWLVLAGTVLVPRLILALFLGVWGQPEPFEYDIIAQNIHAGAGHIYQRGMYSYAAYAPPAWSYLLAFLMALPGESRLSIQVVQALFCLGTALTCAALAGRVSTAPNAPLLAGGLVALQPSLLYYSVVKSDPLPLNAFLLSVIVLWGSMVVECPGKRRAFAFGLLTALATLSRGTPAIAIPIVALLLAIQGRRALAARGESRVAPGFHHGLLVPLMAMSAGFGLGLAPWLVRNAIFVGEPLITTTSGENFWRGNNPLATGGVADKLGRTLTSLSPDNETYSPFPQAIREVLAHGTEAERQHVFYGEAWRFIFDQPHHALFLFGEKLRTFWWRIESRPEDYSPAKALAYQWIYRAELALAVFGLAALFTRRARAPSAALVSTAVLLFAMMAGISLLQSAFYVQGRHRFLIEPLLLIFTTCGTFSLTERLRSRMP